MENMHLIIMKFDEDKEKIAMAIELSFGINQMITVTKNEDATLLIKKENPSHVFVDEELKNDFQHQSCNLFEIIWSEERSHIIAILKSSLNMPSL